MDNLIKIGNITQGIEFKVETAAIKLFPHVLKFSSEFKNKCLFVIPVDYSDHNDSRPITVGAILKTGCTLYCDSTTGTGEIGVLAIG